MLCVAPAAPAAAACEVLVAVAQHDSPEFRRQSQEYGQVSSRQRPAQLRRDAAPASPLGPAEPARSSCAVSEQYFCCCGGGCCRRQQRLGGGRKSLLSCHSCCPVRGRWGSGSLLPAPPSLQALRAAGWSVSLLDLAGVDHFDIIEKLSEESYVLTQVGEGLPSALRSLSRAKISSPGGLCRGEPPLRTGAGAGLRLRGWLSPPGVEERGQALLTGLGSSSQVILNMISRA